MLTGDNPARAGEDSYGKSEAIMIPPKGTGPKLTYKEIQVVLKNIPITDEEYEKNKDNFYGIELDEIRKFEKIYRYYPYYTEGCLNT